MQGGHHFLNNWALFWAHKGNLQSVTQRSCKHNSKYPPYNYTLIQ